MKSLALAAILAVSAGVAAAETITVQCEPSYMDTRNTIDIWKEEYQSRGKPATFTIDYTPSVSFNSVSDGTNTWNLITTSNRGYDGGWLYTFPGYYEDVPLNSKELGFHYDRRYQPGKIQLNFFHREEKKIVSTYDAFGFVTGTQAAWKGYNENYVCNL